MARVFVATRLVYSVLRNRNASSLHGVLLVADSNRLIERNVRFDERFDFHFYDMDFCRQAEIKGLRMETRPISVIHESGGNFDCEAWRGSYQAYSAKYGE